MTRFLITGLLGLVLVAPTLAQDPIKWQLLDPDCELPGVELLHCGQYGNYLIQEPGRSFDWRGGDTCQFLANGEEVPPRLAVPSVQSLLWQPCEGGSCFEPAGVVPPAEYGAVVDWNQAHGHTVGATIQQVANGMALKLYDLEDPGQPLIEQLSAVGDAHVLAQLCAVAEDAETQPATALNMSFGRIDSGQNNCAAAESLRCEIQAVLTHLRDDYQMLEVAAAGNHDELLFPASAQGVVSVGSIDLARLSPTGLAQPQEHSPMEANALFPGYGLFLEEPDGSRVWAAPPGASYASAVATGWLIGYERFYPGTIDPLRQGVPGQRVVTKRAPDALVELYLNGKPLPGSDLSAPLQLLRTAFGQRPHVCNGLPTLQSFVLDLAPSEAPTLGSSFAQQAATAVHPAPDSALCVPCQLHPRRRLRAAPDQASEPSGSRVETPFDGAVLEFEAASGLGPGVSLEAVYLVRNQQWFQFEGRDIAEFLAAIATGDGGEAILEDFEFALDAEVSLVYQLRNIADGLLFWDTTPITVHQDLFDAYLMSDDFESGDTATVW